jgi:WD40 repeat protein
MAFSPDSRRLALVSSRGLEVWSIPDCRRLGERLAESSYSNAAFRQDRRNVVAFTEDGKHLLTIRGVTARLWRMSFFESPPAVTREDDPAALLESWLTRTALKFDEQGELKYRD